MGTQVKLYKTSGIEKRSLCFHCRGYKKLCRKAICPILAKAKAFTKLENSIFKDKIFGASPPAVFVGSWNYPKILAGPMVPPLFVDDTSVLDLPEFWIDKSFNEILQYRFSLVRGKRFTNINAARNPTRILSTFQEIVMASKPTDTEMWFTKKPKFSIAFSSREPPLGPSASITRTFLAENPKIPKPIEYVVSDTDLKAEPGIRRLYDSKINQRQITRMFSIGLLGMKKQRKLVPTEWSITAIDDILGKALHKEILNYSWINEFRIFGHTALANNIQVLLFPTSWMFEAQEVWVISSNSCPEMNYELLHGRKSYANNLAGAYYATRLPVLEYLKRVKRQAGALVFMEVYPEWIPLGVWRFREICREAMRQPPILRDTLGGALQLLEDRLRLPLNKWLEKSAIVRVYQTQTRLSDFLLS